MKTLIRQIAWAVFSIWAVATLCFVAIHRLPGDPARLILGPLASSEAVSNFRRDAGLDQPLGVQYAHYVARLARMDFRQSHALRRPVSGLLRERGAVSAVLASAALGVALLVGLGVPLICRWRGRLRVLAAARALASTTAFVPPHVMATAMLLLLAGVLGWMPVLFDSRSVLSWVVPALVLAAYPAALSLQLFDARLAAESAAPYCARARAAGLPESYILWREAAPNAVPAALAALTNGLAFFVTGALFVEAVFGLPGLGGLTQDALRTQDVSVLAGICVVVAAFVVLLALALRVAQAALDPRLSSHEE